jgi:hypothetical protein
VALATIIGDQMKENATATSTTPDNTKKSPKEVVVGVNSAKASVTATASGNDMDRITIFIQYTFYEEHKKLLKTNIRQCKP